MYRSEYLNNAQFTVDYDSLCRHPKFIVGVPIIIWNHSL